MNKRLEIIWLTGCKLKMKVQRIPWRKRKKDTHAFLYKQHVFSTQPQC